MSTNTQASATDATQALPGAIYRATREVLQEFGPQTTREVFKVLKAIGEVNLKPDVPVLNQDAWSMALVRDTLHAMRKLGLIRSRKSAGGLIWTLAEKKGSEQ